MESSYPQGAVSERLREATRTGRPCGEADFVEGLGAVLGPALAGADAQSPGKSRGSSGTDEFRGCVASLENARAGCFLVKPFDGPSPVRGASSIAKGVSPG